MKVKTLDELLVHELKDLYNAENRILKALPKMAEAASDPELQKAFRDHLEETRGQVSRLEKIFEGLDYEPGGQKCEASEGLIAEGDEIIKELDKGAVRDAALIGAAQRVEHYEMAGYGTARTYAQILGKKEAMRLLQETLDQEGEANKKLNALAQRINQKALSA
ncbi:MAG: ferritin-like domain-containing protein [Candidatus Eremiobacteraeota bacterium]|nr:ferritin-like domain-containing protein [Candidatus Eremiobacteraeota bacterium]